jgi:ribosomal protein S18 acetylase RimI-like enzyme
MKCNLQGKVRIIELMKSDLSLPKLNYHYIAASFFDMSIVHGKKSWKIELIQKPLEKPLEKNFTGTLFEEHIEEPRAFAVVLNDEQIGWIEVGYEKWNNRMRVWEFLVKDKFRRMGVGTLLMDYAVKIAKEKGARMLVLEMQSCNVAAMAFYLKQGFTLIGFDCAAYSNADIEKKEVRIEMGLKL